MMSARRTIWGSIYCQAINAVNELPSEQVIAVLKPLSCEKSGHQGGPPARCLQTVDDKHFCEWNNAYSSSSQFSVLKMPQEKVDWGNPLKH